MPKPVTVVVHIKARPGKEAQTREELLKLLAPTRKEQGCLNYDMHESPDDKALFLFHENWASKQDLDRHLQAPHLKAWREAARELLAEPLALTLWNRL
jgi:quinol monooxygenase YgiN